MASEQPEFDANAAKVSEYHLRLKDAAELLLGHQCITNADYQIVGVRLARAAKRRSGPYDLYYVKALFEGRKPISRPIAEAIDLLMAELTATPPQSRQAAYYRVEVRVPMNIDVAPGSIVLAASRTCICGQSFIPVIYNQQSHTAPCAALRERMHRRLKWRRSQP